MVVIGGLGSLPGAALGAAIVVIAPEVLRSSGEMRLILFGLLVILLAGTGNRGLAGLTVDLFAFIRGWLRRRSSDSRCIGGMMAGLLAIHGLSRHFGGLVAVNAVDMEIEPGTVHGLIGPNGAGKTTLLNLVSGICRQRQDKSTSATTISRAGRPSAGRAQASGAPSRTSSCSAR